MISELGLRTSYDIFHLNVLYSSSQMLDDIYWNPPINFPHFRIMVKRLQLQDVSTCQRWTKPKFSSRAKNFRLFTPWEHLPHLNAYVYEWIRALSLVLYHSPTMMLKTKLYYQLKFNISFNYLWHTFHQQCFLFQLSTFWLCELKVKMKKRDKHWGYIWRWPARGFL